MAYKAAAAEAIAAATIIEKTVDEDVSCVIILFLIRFKMYFYLIESTHRKGYSNELASFFRINTFGRFNDGFISIFSSHVAKIRL